MYKQSKIEYLNVVEHRIIKTHLFLSRVLDGDGIISNDLHNKSEVKIRFIWYRCHGNKIVLPRTNITIELEKTDYTDLCGWTLAGVRCLNEIMIAEGYAKPYSRYYCQELELISN